MRRRFVILAIILQLAVLGYMASKRELILATGQQIYLQTAPIDPRDPFRGDYVRLTYPFNTVNQQYINIENKQKLKDKGYQVYAVLKPSENHVFLFDYLTDQKPENQIVIKGRIDNRRWAQGGGLVNVKYGIEQLFVEQGTGRQIERIRGGRTGIQVPMEVQVAIGNDGTAVLRDYLWSKLGMKLEVVRLNRNRRNRQRNQFDENQTQAAAPLSPKLKITIKNVSDSAVSIVDPGDHCSFHLVQVLTWSSATYTPLDTSCKNVNVSKQALIKLRPDASYQVELDLTKPRWHMLIKHKNGQVRKGEIGISNNNQMFRIVYQSPKSERLTTLIHERHVWFGRLSSRAFNANGRVD